MNVTEIVLRVAAWLVYSLQSEFTDINGDILSSQSSVTAGDRMYD